MKLLHFQNDDSEHLTSLRVQPKSRRNYFVAVLPSVHLGPPTGLAWDGETPGSPLAERGRAERLHQFAVFAPCLPEGPQMGRMGATEPSPNPDI